MIIFLILLSNQINSSRTKEIKTNIFFDFSNFYSFGCFKDYSLKEREREKEKEIEKKNEKRDSELKISFLNF